MWLQVIAEWFGGLPVNTQDGLLVLIIATVAASIGTYTLGAATLRKKLWQKNYQAPTLIAFTFPLWGILWLLVRIPVIGMKAYRYLRRSVPDKITAVFVHDLPRLLKVTDA